MQFKIDQALEVLARTPHVLRAALAGISDGWRHGTYGPDTFSPHDVVGHLITGERTDWMVRVRMILESGASRPFPKYDRYAQFEESQGRSIGELLDEFEALRAGNLVQLRALQLTPADLARRGLHPALGEVTLENLLATWAAHDLNHIAQIARTMAWQYEGAVGPWKAYLGVLKGEVVRMDDEGAGRKRAAGQRPGGSRADDAPSGAAKF